MKSLYKILPLFAGVLFALYLESCSEFIEDDITSDSVQIIGPKDTVIQYATITFWWEPVEGATSYRLQVVSPAFESPIRFVLDTLLSSTKFNFTPEVGDYEWRVRAENSGYTSPYTTPQKLEIIDGNDLSRVEVKLVAPPDQLFTNDTSLQFVWEPIPIATSYKIRVEGDEVFEEEITTSSFEHSVPKLDRVYSWRVTAINETSSSTSQPFTFTVDLTVPSSPDLVFPEVDSVLDLRQPVSFEWVRDSDVAVDSFFIEKNIDNAWEPFPGFISKRLLAPTLTITTDDLSGVTTNDLLRWSVVSFDRAGNKSMLSRSAFTVGSL